MRRIRQLGLLFVPLVTFSLASAQTGVMPLLDGLGAVSMKVTTRPPEAQAYFDQGLRLLYAFNHNQAELSFQRCAELDPVCAMAHWGRAVALGPTINTPMSDQKRVLARQAIAQAQELSAGVTARERALIQALAARYGEGDSAELNQAYTKTLRALSAEYPDDLDIAVFSVAAYMESTPWNYWNADGSPYEGTAAAQATLEAALAKDPQHIGAIHYYIHLVEAAHPKLAEPYADRLADLAPSSGHLVHMPSHIYLRLGRYADASAINERAILADKAYVDACRASGIYIEYYTHNMHFLWASATMEGRSARALEAAGMTAGQACCTGEMLAKEDVSMTRYLGQVRFGRWDDVLATPAPPEDARYATGIWHYGQGVALAALGRLEEAQQHLAALQAVAADPALETLMVNFDTAQTVLSIPLRIVEAEIAAQRKDFDRAVALLTEAVAVQDQLAYMEPPTWHYPVRQSLGAVLLAAGRPAHAQAVYRADLEHWPDNGWSLFGLRRALEAQGKTAEAAEVGRRFDQAFRQADIQLTASVYR